MEPKTEEIEQTEGELAAYLQRKLGPSWRTSLVGYVNFLCVIVVAIGQALPQHIPHAVVTVATTLMGAMMSLGFVKAKDKSTTGAQ